jgi:hypothetical protein
MQTSYPSSSCRRRTERDSLAKVLGSVAEVGVAILLIMETFVTWYNELVYKLIFI